MSESIEYRLNKYPIKYETNFKLENGKTLIIRPVKPTDKKMVQELHYSLDKQDRFYRFFSFSHNFSLSRIEPLVKIKYDTDMVLVAEYWEKMKNSIVALAGLFKKMSPEVGELIFITHKKWRNLGIAKFLLNYLIKIAKELNFTKLGGSIYNNNNAMYHIINSIKYNLVIKKINNEFSVVLMDITKIF